MDKVKETRYFINVSKKAFHPDDLIEVRHMKDTSKYNPKDYDSWKEFWLEKTGNLIPDENGKCPCCQDETTPEGFVGGHVRSVENEYEQFVCLVCKSCNSKYGKGKKESDTFKVKFSECALFSADKDAYISDPVE